MQHNNPMVQTPLPNCKPDIIIVTIGPNFQSRSDSPWSENHLLENGTALDASVGLEKFQEWLKEKHAELPNFDHAMAFTGFVYGDL